LKTVDPKRVTDALAGLNAGLLAIIATLKLQFAKSITLGNSIASLLEQPAKQYVVPNLKAAMHPDFQKWAEPLTIYAIKSTAISIAWMIQRVMSAFHSAIRGGHMFAHNVLDYLTTMGYMTEEVRKSSNLDTFLAPGNPFFLDHSPFFFLQQHSPHFIHTLISAIL
jgi:hypothetical protein